VNLLLRTSVLVLALGALQVEARADNLDEFGLGPRASAMGGAMTGLASDWTATYYNPAGLIGSKHVNTEIGFQYADYQLNFSTLRGGSQVDSRTNRIDPLSAYTLGFSSTIAVDEPDRIAVGIGLFIPTRHVTNISEETPSDQPEWVFYGDHQDRLQVIPGVAVKIIDGLSVGGAATIFATSKGGSIANVGPPLDASFSLDLKPSIGGIFGIFFQPMKELSFGLTYRTERSFKLTFEVDTTVIGLITPITLQAIDFYTPHQASLGTAIDLLDGRALLALDFTYLAYHAFRDTFLVATSPTLPTLTKQNGNFNDEYIPRVGLEFAATDWLCLRAGYYYRSSPVGQQRNKTFNIVDSDEHVFTVGVGFEYSREPVDASAPKDAPKDEKDEKKPETKTTSWGVFDHASVGLDVFFQYHFLPGISVRKSDPNDPIGGYDASGSIFNMGIALTGRF
jgi:long-chain fatty acid transport protein